MRRFFEPATAPAWLKPVLSSIRAALGDVWDAPVRPFQAPGAALPPAGEHEGGLAFETGAGRLRCSNGATWLTFVDTSSAAFTGNVTVGGTFGVAGSATFGGNVTLGDAPGDSHTVNGTLTVNDAFRGPAGNIAAKVPGLAFAGITDAGLVGHADNVGLIESGVLRLVAAGSTEKAARVPADHKIGWSSANDNLSAIETYFTRSGAGGISTPGAFSVGGNTTLGDAAGDSHLFKGTVQIAGSEGSSSLTIDRIGSIVGRFRLFVGDGTSFTADENYISSPNTALHFLHGATGTTERMAIGTNVSVSTDLLASGGVRQSGSVITRIENSFGSLPSGTAGAGMELGIASGNWRRRGMSLLSSRVE